MAFDATQWQITVKLNGLAPSAVNNGQTLVITQDNLVGLTDQAGTPVNFFDIVQPDGSDIRLSEDAAGSDEIPIQKVDIDTGIDNVTIWTRKPIYELSDRLVHLHIGKPDAVEYDVTDIFGRNAVWQGLNAVFHLNELSGDFINSTGDGNDATVSPTTGVARGATGILGPCVDLDERQSPIIPQGSYWNASFNTHTISAWCEIGGETSGPNIILEEGGSTNGAYLAYRTTPDTFHYGVRSNDGHYELSSTTTFPPNSGFIKVVGTFDNGVARLFVNGVLEDTLTVPYTSVAAHGDNAGIGDTNGTDSQGASYPWLGKIGHAKRSPLTTSESFESTEYANQNEPATFWDVVSVTNRAAGGGGEEQVVVLSNAVQAERASALNISQHQPSLASQAIQRESASTLLIEAIQQVAVFNAIQAERAQSQPIVTTQHVRGRAAIQNESATPLNIEQAGAQNITLVNAVQAETASTLSVELQQTLQGIIAVQLENAGVSSITEAQAITLATARQNETAAALNIEQYSGQLVTLIAATQKETAPALFISTVSAAELRPATQKEVAQQHQVTQHQQIIQVSAVQREVAEIMRILTSGDMTDLTGLRLVPITETYSLKPVNQVTYTLREL